MPERNCSQYPLEGTRTDRSTDGEMHSSVARSSITGAQLEEEGAGVARAHQQQLRARRQRLHRRDAHERLEKVLEAERGELLLAALGALVDGAARLAL